jgi:hypothetical protein
MNRSNVRTIALVGATVLIVAALLGGVAAGALDDDTETVTTAIPASDAAVENPTAQLEAGADGAQPNRGDAADAGIIDPDDRPLTKAELDRVQRAAVEIAGGGTVSDVDRSDDLGEAYEVEVLTDVGEVDIALDGNLERVPNLRYDD